MGQTLHDLLFAVATAELDRQARENPRDLPYYAGPEPGDARVGIDGAVDLDALVRAIGRAATLDAAVTVENLRIRNERDPRLPHGMVATPPEIAAHLRREADGLARLHPRHP